MHCIWSQALQVNRLGRGKRAQLVGKSMAMTSSLKLYPICTKQSLHICILRRAWCQQEHVGFALQAFR